MASRVDTLPGLPRRRWPPALLALAALGLAWLPFLPLYLLAWPLSVLVVGQGLLAWRLARLFALPPWWQAINGLFFPAAWLVSRADIAPAWFLAGFLLLALTSLGSLATRVPLYLSSRRAAQAVAERAPQGARVLDLGCGLGGWLADLKRLRPDLDLAGVEIAPLNWLIARLRLHGRATIRFGSLWDLDLGDHDIVYAYLSPAPMAELWRKVAAEMAPGSLFVSNTFAVPGQVPGETVELHDLSHARLLIWRR